MCSDKIVILINIQLVHNLHKNPVKYVHKTSAKTQKKCKKNEISLLKRSNRPKRTIFLSKALFLKLPVGSTKNVLHLLSICGIIGISVLRVNNIQVST